MISNKIKWCILFVVTFVHVTNNMCKFISDKATQFSWPSHKQNHNGKSLYCTQDWWLFIRVLLLCTRFGIFSIISFVLILFHSNDCLSSLLHLCRWTTGPNEYQPMRLRNIILMKSIEQNCFICSYFYKATTHACTETHTHTPTQSTTGPQRDKIRRHTLTVLVVRS